MNEHNPSFDKTFFNEIQLAIIHPDNVAATSLAPVLPKSKVLGEADEYIRRLISVLGALHAQRITAVSLIDKQDSPEARVKCKRRCQSLQMRVRAMSFIIYIEIANRFPAFLDIEFFPVIYLTRSNQIAVINQADAPPEMLMAAIAVQVR